MPVHPIEFRYHTKEMYQIWTDENRLQRLLDAEAALAYALGQNKLIPLESAKTIIQHANIEDVKLERVNEIEQTTHHDIMALVLALSEQCDESGRFVHFGATSADISDTATSLQIRDAFGILDTKLEKLLQALLKLAEKTKTLVCVGRTHGQHAIPTTYGMKFIRWATEIERHIQRLDMLRTKILRAKLSGAVGTMASFGDQGFKMQTSYALYLKLEPVDVASQIVPRDNYAEYIFWCALVAATLETIAKEIRNLQRTEIFEIAEPFAKKQVGSSTMAQKRNPHKSERICGLARILRGYITPAIENIALEHERDLTNSSPERILIPGSSILLDYLLKQMTGILDGLEFFPENINRNLNFTKGLINTEHIMLELTKKGMSRQTAHETLRKIGIESKTKQLPLVEILKENKAVTDIASQEEINQWLDPSTYIGTAPLQVENLIQRIQKFLQSRDKK